MSTGAAEATHEYIKVNTYTTQYKTRFRFQDSLVRSEGIHGEQPVQSISLLHARVAQRKVLHLSGIRVRAEVDEVQLDQ